MSLPGPTCRVPRHIEDELILGAELDEAKIRMAKLEEALRGAVDAVTLCGEKKCKVCAWKYLAKELLANAD